MTLFHARSELTIKWLTPSQLGRNHEHHGCRSAPSPAPHPEKRHVRQRRHIDPYCTGRILRRPTPPPQAEVRLRRHIQLKEPPFGSSAPQHHICRSPPERPVGAL